MIDVPSPIDLRCADDAAAWVRDADVKRPWRAQLRDAFAELLAREPTPPRRVLELGPGPGLLAERVLCTLPIEHLTLLDFSPAMLAMSRDRLGDRPDVTLRHADYRSPDWTAGLVPALDAVIAMQAVHEVRHKRHLPTLYRQVLSLLRPGGLVLICDHEPPDGSPRMTALHATADEQLATLAVAGFAEPTVHVTLHGLYLVGGRRPRPVPSP